MHITFCPIRGDHRPTFERRGGALIIDGEAFDFSGIPEGATLPAGAVASDWVVGPVERAGGVLRLTLALSHGPNAPEATRFAQPITVTADGEIALPEFDAPKQEENPDG